MQRVFQHPSPVTLSCAGRIMILLHYLASSHRSTTWCTGPFSTQNCKPNVASTSARRPMVFFFFVFSAMFSFFSCFGQVVVVRVLGCVRVCVCVCIFFLLFRLRCSRYPVVFLGKMTCSPPLKTVCRTIDSRYAQRLQRYLCLAFGLFSASVHLGIYARVRLASPCHMI